MSDGERFGLLRLRHQAIAFALIFLRTDAAGDRGQRVVLADLGGGAEVVAVDDQLREVLHLHRDRTAARARRLRAREAAQCFQIGEIGLEPEVHFLEVVRAEVRVALRHVLPGHLHAVFVWYRVRHCCSCSRYIALRCMSTLKSTSCASNSGPSTQANRLLPPISTRQPPHMPVPSTMIELRLTTVRTFDSRVVLATARIIGIGPMART